MEKIFKCDCGTHLIEIGYTKPAKNFDAEDMFFAIYNIYNPETGKKYRSPKLAGDVVIFNNSSPKELDELFKFLKKIIENRTLPKSGIKVRADKKWIASMNESIKRIKEANKKQWEKERERCKKNKKDSKVN